MRIPLSKHYRAFREFDGFDDATCERLLKRARNAQSAKSQALNLLIFLPLLFLVLAGGAAIFVFAVDNVDVMIRRAERAAWAYATGFCVLVAVASVPLVVLLVAVDGFRRRDLQRELERTRCAKCRYGFIGLPVENDAVRCPECGEVMPLGDLSPSAAALIRAGAE